ncbi:MAG: LLM class flavin-dependent oxidoreductase [Thermomicrobiales bacterium]
MPGHRRLKVGLHLPETERIAPWQDLAEMCRTAEDVGFDSIWMPDHLLYRSPGEETTGPWECWSVLSAVAAITSQVEIGPLVLCTSFRNPALIAKMAATIDEVSNGRLILGLGAGWNEPEYSAYGFPFDHRLERFDEAFTIIRKLLREGQVDFTGKFYQARDCELRPRGPRPQGPPLMIGSRGPKLLRKTMAYADSWNGWGAWFGNRGPGIDPFQAEVDAACREVGRDPAEVERTCAVFIRMPNAEGEIDPVENDVMGSPEEMAELLRDFASHGVTHLQVLLDPNTVESVEAFAPVLKLVHNE